MEEVWREINPSSLHDQPPTAAAFRNGCPATAVSLQDFLARPFHKDIIHNDPFSHHSPSPAAAATYSVPPPTAVLGLTFQTTGPVSGKIRVPDAAQLHARGSPYVDPLYCKGRAPPPPLEDGEDHSERKRKRLMKNRESAARSRARKQAYTNELENELEKLQDENAKLRRQYHELRLAVPALLPQKQSLRRTLTAPF